MFKEMEQAVLHQYFCSASFVELKDFLNELVKLIYRSPTLQYC